MLPIYATDHGQSATTMPRVQLTDHQQFLDYTTERFPSRDSKHIAAVIGLFMYLSQQSYPTGFADWTQLLFWTKSPAGTLLLAHADAAIEDLRNCKVEAPDYGIWTMRELVRSLWLRRYFSNLEERGQDVNRLPEQELVELEVFGHKLRDWTHPQVLQLLARSKTDSYSALELSSAARMIWGDDASGK